MGRRGARTRPAAALALALAASALPLVAAAPPAGAGAGVGARVALFDDAAYVDTANGLDSEADNVAASLTALGHSVTTFTGTSAAAFSAALAGADVLVVPELETAALAPALAGDARAAIAAFVASGGGMVVVGGTAPRAGDLVNAVLATSVVEGSAAVAGTRRAAAAGSEFAAEAASLGANDATTNLSVASLPAGARSIYDDTTRSAVAVLAHGAGSVTFLGWDWYDSAPPNATGQDAGWQSVLDAAVERPTLAVGDVTVTEGHTATTPASFRLTLSGPVSEDVVVQWSTVAGTAGAGRDFTASSGTATVARGTTSATVEVPVVGDVADEDDEGFEVVLGAARVAVVTDARGTATVVDDDPPPALSVGDVTVAEPASGRADATFGVTLSAPSGRVVRASWATADGTASAGADYTAASGTVTFAPGEQAATVVVAVLADTAAEGAETFDVVLSAPVNATVADGGGTATVTDAEVAPPPPEDPPPGDDRPRRRFLRWLHKLLRHLHRHHGHWAGWHR